MPKPIYIICSQSGTEDKETGFVSIFNVVEKFQTSQIKSIEAEAIREGKPIIMQYVPLRVISTWMLEKFESKSNDYEYEFKFIFPSGKTAIFSKGMFKFDKDFHRFTAKIDGPLPLEEQSGLLLIQCRTRMADSGEWASHEYPIVIEIDQPSESKQDVA